MILIWFADLASTVLCFPTCHDSTPKTPKAMAARMVMSWDSQLKVRAAAVGSWLWEVGQWVLDLGDMQVDLICSYLN